MFVVCSVRPPLTRLVPSLPPPPPSLIVKVQMGEGIDGESDGVTLWDDVKLEEANAERALVWERATRQLALGGGITFVGALLVGWSRRDSLRRFLAQQLCADRAGAMLVVLGLASAAPSVGTLLREPKYAPKSHASGGGEERRFSFRTLNRTFDADMEALADISADMERVAWFPAQLRARFDEAAKTASKLAREKAATREADLEARLRKDLEVV